MDYRDSNHRRTRPVRYCVADDADEQPVIRDPLSVLLGSRSPSFRDDRRDTDPYNRGARGGWR
jgi:hypothetical protein